MKLPHRVQVLAAAAALDLLLGEPPAPIHPVIHLGRFISALERRAPPHGRWRQLTWGAGVALGVPAVAAMVGGLAETGGRRAGPAAVLGEASLLSTAFALRALLAAGESVRLPLTAGDLEGARAAIRGLVSRDTDELGEALIAAAAIESLAENLTDSVVAPWLAYAVGGLPAAFAYRAINTLDSMVGYRGRYEYLGKASARLDDLANLIPARVTAALIALVAPAGGGDGLPDCAQDRRESWTLGGQASPLTAPDGSRPGTRDACSPRSAPTGHNRMTLGIGAARDAATAAWRYHGRTASPNAGWTMAAMAGALRRRLEKSGHYILGDGSEPAPRDIRRAQRIVAATAGVALIAAIGTAVSVERLRSLVHSTADADTPDASGPISRHVPTRQDRA